MQSAVRQKRGIVFWTFVPGLLAVPLVSSAFTGDDPYSLAASQRAIAELTSISATVGPTGVVNYTFAGFHPAITGVVFTGRGGWNPITKQASERLTFPQGTISSQTTCDADPWAEQTTCSKENARVNASSGAPVDLALLPYGAPIGAMLLSPQAHFKAKAAYAEGFRNRPTPTRTPTHTPVPRFVRSGGREVVLPTPTPAPLSRIAAPAGGRVSGALIVQTPTPTATSTATRPPIATPTWTPTRIPTRTATPLPASPVGPAGGVTGKVARLPLASVAAFLNDALQGTRVRLHTAGPGGGYANDSYVALGPGLGGARIPLAVPAPTFQAGAFASTLFVNDVNSTGISASLSGNRFLVTVTFESAGPELLVRGPAPMDVEADNGRLVLTLTPGLDASGRPSFSTVDADLSANVRCTAPNQILAGICNSVEPFAVNFLRNQAAQAFRQAFQTPDFRARVGAALRGRLDAPDGKTAVERASGQKIGTIHATRFEGDALVIDHD